MAIAEWEKVYTAATLAELREVASQLLIDFPEGVFVLEGELGAGKTALVKAFGEVLGVDDEVSSPTFGIVNEYQGEQNIIYHFDLYRLQRTSDLAEIGFGEYVYAPEAIIFIEWPDIALPLLPETYTRIRIWREEDSQTRRITAFTEPNRHTG